MHNKSLDTRNFNVLQETLSCLLFVRTKTSFDPSLLYSNQSSDFFFKVHNRRLCARLARHVLARMCKLFNKCRFIKCSKTRLDSTPNGLMNRSDLLPLIGDLGETEEKFNPDRGRRPQEKNHGFPRKSSEIRIPYGYNF